MSIFESRPIIVRVVEQVCDGYSLRLGNVVLRIKNIGLDKDGNKWQFFSEHIHHKNGYVSFGMNYGYIKLGKYEE